METLLTYERDLFLTINGTHTPFLDTLLWPFASKWIWCPLALVLLYLIWRDRKKCLPAVIALVVTIACCIIMSSYICKPVFMRFRPTTHPLFMDYVTLLNDYKADGLYGFISGHATNAFGFAVVTLLLIRNKIYTVIILLWAILIGYSRVYMGAHFVSDVIAGMLVGVCLGWLGYHFYKYLIRRRSSQYTHIRG